VFHDTRERFGGSQLDTLALPHLRIKPLGLIRWRAWAFLPTVPEYDRASDTSVASPSSPECRSAFAFLQLSLFPGEEAAEVALTIAS